MATHSSVLAWRIPGTEEPDGLPSVGLHRVGHDWSDLTAAAAAAGYLLPPQWHYNLSWKVEPRLEKFTSLVKTFAHNRCLNLVLSYWNLSRINLDSIPRRLPLTTLDPVLDEEGPSSVVQPSFNQKDGLVGHTWQGCILMEVGGVPCPSLPFPPLGRRRLLKGGAECSAPHGHSGLLAGCLCCRRSKVKASWEL